MKIEKTVCPYCGANMKILPGQEHAECEYCGSSVVISMRILRQFGSDIRSAKRKTERKSVR